MLAWHERRDLADEVISRTAPSMGQLMNRQGLRDAAFCHRHREITREQGKELAAAWQTKFDAWATANPESDAILARMKVRGLPEDADTASGLHRAFCAVLRDASEARKRALIEALATRYSLDPAADHVAAANAANAASRTLATRFQRLWTARRCASRG